MRLVSRLQNMRHAGDYDDMFDWAEEDVKPLFNRTELLIKKIYYRWWNSMFHFVNLTLLHNIGLAWANR